jgi:hypothetical protein
MRCLMTTAVLLIATASHATPVLSVPPNAVAGVHYSWAYDSGLGGWRLNIFGEPSTSQQGTWIITPGASTDVIAYVTHHANSGPNSILRLPTGSGGIRFQSVGPIGQLYSGLIVNEVESANDIGAVSADFIGTINAGRDVVGDIIAETGYITAVTASRDILGSVEAIDSLGYIGWVTAGGDIGTSGDPGVIRARNYIRSIVADVVYADVRSGQDGSTTQGYLGLISVDTLIGDVHVTELAVVGTSGPKILVDSSCAGTITIDKQFVSGSDRQIRVPLNGLQSQIIFNAGNHTSPTWTAPVKVGPDGNPSQVQLTSSTYSNTSASLGGGSVGLAPFHLHDEDCIPANGYSGAAPGDNIIRLRWYGPIDWTSGYPVTVSYLSGSTWIDISDWFEYEPGANPRELEIIPLDMGTDWGAVTYLITPTSNLKCVGVSDTPAVYPEDAYMATFTFN